MASCWGVRKPQDALLLENNQLHRGSFASHWAITSRQAIADYFPRTTRTQVFLFLPESIEALFSVLFL